MELDSANRNSLQPLPPGHIAGQPLTALAPMQDVTDLPFMTVVSRYGSPDYFVTEYFRVHAQSRLEKHILKSITENRTGRPVFAQMIGEDPDELCRTARELERYSVAGVDLNMGCPAPKVYKKNCGGGLMRDPGHVDEILGRLRDTVSGRFTVKMRVGFDSTDTYEQILALINKHGVDLLSIHGRTVKEGYRGDVHYDLIGNAVRTVRCPVLANGNITSAKTAVRVIAETGAAGVMVGRSAIRNPWIFGQLRDHLEGKPIRSITLGDVRDYVDSLYTATQINGIPELAHVGRMKKFLNFVGQGVDADGAFLYEMRRTRTEADLFSVFDRHLSDRAETRFADEPFEGVIARPNCEAPLTQPSGSSRG